MDGTRTIDALRRFWWVVLAFAVVGGIVGGLPAPENAADSVTRWTASHTILVSSSSSAGSIYSDPMAFNQLQLFATTGQVPERAAKAIGFDGPPAALTSEVTVTSDQQSGALRIATTQETGDEAVAVADAFADELIGYLTERQDSLQQDRLTASLTRLQELETQLEDAEAEAGADRTDAVAQAQLDALSRQYSVAFEQFNALQSDEQGQLVLTTLERAQPVAVTETGLSAPRSRVGRGLIGAVVGALLGVGVAVLLARADRRIRTREQAEQVFGMAAHATIPVVSGHDPVELAVVPERHDPLSDSYRTLRSIISFVDAATQRPDAGGAVVLVVSPGPGDGKTSMTANLTAAFVEAGNQTVAVNTDFRRPALTKRLAVGHPEPIGLELHEIEHAPLELVLTPSQIDGLSVLDLSPMKGHNPGDLARVSARLLPRIAAERDVVVVDTSPVGATAEVLEFVPLADTIVMVVRLGHTSIQMAKRAIETVRALSSANIVLALVGGDANESGYYYYYSSTEPRPTGLFGRKKLAAVVVEEPTVST